MDRTDAIDRMLRSRPESEGCEAAHASTSATALIHVSVRPKDNRPQITRRIDPLLSTALDSIASLIGEARCSDRQFGLLNDCSPCTAEGKGHGHFFCKTTGLGPGPVAWCTPSSSRCANVRLRGLNGIGAAIPDQERSPPLAVTLDVLAFVKDAGLDRLAAFHLNLVDVR